MLSTWILVLYIAGGGVMQTPMGNKDSCLVVVKKVSHATSLYGVCIEKVSGRVINWKGEEL